MRSIKEEEASDVPGEKRLKKMEEREREELKFSILASYKARLCSNPKTFALSSNSPNRISY